MTEMFRSDGASELDATFEWLKGRVPHRVPEGFTAKHADPSWQAAAAGELRRVTLARFGARPSDVHELRRDLEKLPRLLLSYEVDGRALRALRDSIDRRLQRLENPEPMAPAAAHLVELARDLRIELPASSGEAQAAVAAALAARDTGDRRARWAWSALMFCVSNVPGLEARRARRALVGHGLPPVRDDDAEFRAAPADLAPAPGPVKFYAWGAAGDAPPWFERLARDVGAPVPKFPDLAPLRAKEAAELARLQRLRDAEKLATAEDLARADAWTANGVALQRERERVAQEYTRQREAVVQAWAAELDAARARIIGAIDAAIDAADERELGGLAGYWLRRLRAQLATMNQPTGTWESSGEVQLEALHMVASFGIVIDASSGEASPAPARRNIERRHGAKAGS